MRTAAVISASLHIAVVLIAWFGVLPSSRPEITPVQVFDVEVAPDIQKPTPKPKPVAKPKVPPPPPPKPQIASKPEPEAVPRPKPAPPKAVPIPKPKPKPKVVEKPKPKPEPKKQAQKPRPRPKSKPKPPPKHDFASVLKTVSKLERKPPPPKLKPKPEKKPVSAMQQVADALKRKPPPKRSKLVQNGISASEIDAIRRQIEPCWSLPAGARDADKMIVEIKATVGPDGRVRSAVIVDRARASNDRFFRSMAESAVRALLNPRCQPLKLPVETYQDWRNMTLTFYPGEMF